MLVIERVEEAAPIARALVAGGLPALEVTLRTPAALDVIRAMTQVPGAIVGAGTVLNPDQFGAAAQAGAEFVVSPGLTESLAEAAAEPPIPLLPGVASAGDIMRALDLGFTRLKFFPAVASGGVAASRRSARLSVKFASANRRDHTEHGFGLARARSGGVRWRKLARSRRIGGQRGDFHAGLQSSVTALKAIPGLERH